MNRLPTSQRYKPHNKRWHRYEKPQPGHRLQIDVKFIEPLAGSTKKHYQFTAIDDADLFNIKRQEWEDYYNFDRPHGALDGQTPYERLRQKTNTPVQPATVSRTASAPAEPRLTIAVFVGRLGRAFGR